MGKKQHTRQQIIEKAALIFNKKGYAGTSIGNIMEAASLSKGGFYGNFNSKEEVALEAFEYSVNTVTNKARQRSLQKEKSIDKLIAAIDFYREYISTNPFRINISFWRIYFKKIIFKFFSISNFFNFRLLFRSYIIILSW